MGILWASSLLVFLCEVPTQAMNIINSSLGQSGLLTTSVHHALATKVNGAFGQATQSNLRLPAPQLACKAEPARSGIYG